MADRNLPVRVIVPNEDFFNVPEARGGSWDPLIPEDQIPSHKKQLIDDINNIKKEVLSTSKIFPEMPTIIKAKLHPKALAKTKRPKTILTDDTCPIVGVGSLGELYLQTTLDGLLNLKQKIDRAYSKKELSELTALERFHIYTKNEKLLGMDPSKIERCSTRRGETHLKIILFDYKSEKLTSEITSMFRKWVQEKGFKMVKVSKYEKLRIWKIIGPKSDFIEEMSQHPSIKMLSFFPHYRFIKRHKIKNKESLKEVPQPEENATYPTVGVIDSGISENHPQLQNWIVEKVSYVPEPYQNTHHGSSVGSIICMGNLLNGNLIHPDPDYIQLADIQIFPNDDEREGQVAYTNEDEIIAALEETIPKLAKKNGIRIWNMSAGFLTKCVLTNFSSLGMELDCLQDEFDVIFTLPSGNFDIRRPWPPASGVDYNDGLQVPGDSVRAITTSAIACKENSQSYVRINEPTSYSCCGLGPSYIIKPELTHYSGNCGPRSLIGQGIHVFDGDGNLVEEAGTSFSCPGVARTLGILSHRLESNTSINILKALTIHHALPPKNLGSPENNIRYIGFGLPQSVANMLYCNENEITLIVEQDLHRGVELEIPFVWPKSLTRNRRYRGKVTMTLVSQPPLDPRFGSEYIRVNIDAALQSAKRSRDGKLRWKNQIGEYPRGNELKSYEINMIRYGFKWKPIKHYSEVLKRGRKADAWKLKIKPSLRSDTFLDPSTPIKFALILTISDPDGVAPIYDDMVRQLHSIGVLTTSIKLRHRVREMVRG